jgi:integrase
MARELATQAAGDVARGIDVHALRQATREDGERLASNTLSAFIDAKYEPWAKVNLRSAKFQLTRIKKDFAKMLDTPLPDFNLWRIENWRKQRIDAGIKRGTVNRKVQRLSAALSKAVHWRVIDRHPFQGLKPLKADKSGRVRYLLASEESQLREAMVAKEDDLRDARKRFNDWKKARHRPELPPRLDVFATHLRPIVILALNTGMRRGEIFNLRWVDVDLEGKWVTVVGATAKSGHTRRIPLNSEAAETIEAWKKQSGSTKRQDFVFPGVDGKKLTTITTAWRSLRSRAALQNFRFHDLRHHFASRLVQSEVDLNIVRELLGHADLSMVLRYAHLSPDTLKAAVEKVTIDGIAGTGQSARAPISP